MDEIKMTKEELVAMKLHEEKIVNKDSNSSLVILRVADGWIYTSIMRVGATSIFVPEIQELEIFDSQLSEKEFKFYTNFKNFVTDYNDEKYSTGDAHDCLLFFYESLTE